MPNQRIPKMALFGWLPEPRPPGGPRKRWRDQIRQDLKAVGVSEEDWYEEASNRAGWRAIYRQGLQDQYSQQEVPPLNNRAKCTARCVGGVSAEREIELDTSVLQSVRDQCVSSVELCNALSAAGGSTANGTSCP